MISARSSEANTSSNRRLVQQLRSAKPETVVDAYRQVRVPPRETSYEVEHVTVKTDQWLGRLEDLRSWPDKYASKLAHVERGQMSAVNVPYKELGAVVLETGDLITGTLHDSIAEDVLLEYNMTGAELPDVTSQRQTAHDKGQTSEQLALKTAQAALLASTRRCPAAGMDHIRAMLTDTDAWIGQCTMDRPYMDAISRTKQLKQEADEANARESEMMKIEMKPLSPRTLKRLLRVADHTTVRQRASDVQDTRKQSDARLSEVLTEQQPTSSNDRTAAQVEKQFSSYLSVNDRLSQQQPDAEKLGRISAARQSRDNVVVSTTSARLSGAGNDTTADEKRASELRFEVDSEHASDDGQDSASQADAAPRISAQQQLVLEKFDSIYKILCSVINIRPKHLRSRNPLTVRTLQFVARDPFVGRQVVGATQSVASVTGHEGTRTVGPCETRSLPVFDASVMQTGEQTQQTVTRPVSPVKSWVTVTKATSSHLFQPQPPQQQADNRTTPQIPKPVSPAKIVKSGLQVSKKVRVAPATAKSYFDSAPVQIETWDDLVNVGKQKKTAKKMILWQQDLTEQSKQARVQPRQRSSSSGQGDNKSKSKQDVVYRQLESWARARERTQKAAMLKLEKIENNRTTKYRVLLSDLAFVRVNPYFIPERYFLHVRRILADPEVIPEVTVAWYEQLKIERTQANLEENPEMTSLMEKLHRFIYDDICEVEENVMEKMCLLVMSIPADQLSTPAWQRAIVFVMINILECELSYLKEWLAVRHLKLLRFVEEEIEQPAAAARLSRDSSNSVLAPTAQTSQQL